jgi:hypothetical protein
MTHALACIAARLLRLAVIVLSFGAGALSLAATAEAGGGWHGGGWHGGGWHGGGWYGGGWYGGGCCWSGTQLSLSFNVPAYHGYPAYYPYPAYAYYPPYPYPAYTYVQPYYPPAPPVTLAQQMPATAPGPAPIQYWYYCDNPRGYYPYVQSCGAGWRAVPAQPAGTQKP